MAKKYTSMAGMTGNHRVTLVEHDPVIVRIIGADIMRWEQNEGGKSFFEGEIGLSRMAYPAWAAMRRKHLTELTFAEFMKNLEDLESEDDVEEEASDEDEDGAAEVVELPGPTEADTTAW